jgi:CRISPR system Cascade subunit CasE
MELGDSQAMHRRVMSLFPDLDSPSPRSALNVLYRVDPPTAGQPAYSLLVQSSAPPREGAIPAAMLAASDSWGFVSDAVEMRDIGQAYSALLEGQRLIFRLRANVTKRLWLNNPERLAAAAEGDARKDKDALFDKYREKAAERGGKGTGPRVAIFKEEDQLAWLERQGTAHGFTLEDVKVVPGIEALSRPDAGDPPAPKAVQTQAVTAHGWKMSDSRRRRSRQPDLVHNAVTFEGVLSITDHEAFQEALRTGIGPAKAYGFGLLSIRPLR